MSLTAKLERLKWYGARLSAMSASEIVHRIKEKAHKGRLASHAGGWAAFAQDDLPEGEALTGLRQRLSTMPSSVVSDWLMAPRHLGRDWGRAYPHDTAVGDSFWFYDPVSGNHWSGAGVSCFDVDVRSTSARPQGARRFGDVKYVWEPNRLQILMPLAVRMVHASSTGDKAGARAELAQALALLDSWMTANPPFQGVNWSSGIEIALRICSVTFLAAAVSGLTDDAECKRCKAMLSQFAAAHCHWLAQLPSLHSSANNHRVAEGLGLYLAGLVSPVLEQRHGYASEGRRILEAEALLQIYADGVGAEQSPTYQAFTMELIGFGALMARFAGAPFAAGALLRLQAGAEFLAALQFGEGRVPAIGDDDEGRALTNPAVEEPLYAASVCASMAALTGVKCASGKPGYFRERLFGVVDGHEVAARVQELKLFATGGYSVLTGHIAQRDMHLVFDHGPLGYLTLAAHGHADALSVWLALDGRPVFVDAGTWLYHSGEDMRRVIRRSNVHNTLSLPGLSQSEPSAAFSWRNKAQAQLLEARHDGGDDWRLEASHDGFLKRVGVTHRRLIRGALNGFAICDALEGSRDEGPVEIAFLCDPDLSVEQRDGAVLISSLDRNHKQALLKLGPPAGFDAQIQTGDVNPDLAFVSPSFGVMRPAVRILLTGILGARECETKIEIMPP